MEGCCVLRWARIVARVGFKRMLPQGMDGFCCRRGEGGSGCIQEVELLYPGRSVGTRPRALHHFVVESNVSPSPVADACLPMAGNTFDCSFPQAGFYQPGRRLPADGEEGRSGTAVVAVVRSSRAGGGEG